MKATGTAKQYGGGQWPFLLFAQEDEKMFGKLSKAYIAIIWIFLIVFVLSGQAFAKQPEKESEKESWIIMLEDWPALSKGRDWVTSHNGQIKSAYRTRPAMAAFLPRSAAEAMKRVPWVKNVIPDQRVLPISVPSVPYEWGVEHIHADDVHLTNNKGSGINVAILDTGIDYRHNDLNNNYYGGYDFGGYFWYFGENDDDPMDNHGHGTHCSGIVAAEHNMFGVTGVAPEAHLYAVKVFDDFGYCLSSDVIEGLEWCMDTHNDNDPTNDI